MLPPKPHESPRFIADAMLGRLARWLRLIGYDTLYQHDISDDQLAEMSRMERRIILTRDQSVILKPSYKVLLILSGQVREQLEQVRKELRLEKREDRFFTRCSHCNTPLEMTDKKKVKFRVPPHVFKTQDEFSICPSCHKIYWIGSHLDLFRNTLYSS